MQSYSMSSVGGVSTGAPYATSSRSYSSSYKSNIAPRSTSIQRTLAGPSMMTRISQSYIASGGQAGFGIPGAGGFALSGMAGLGKFGSIGVPMRPSGAYGGALVTVNETRLREKHQLSQLNDKFAQYVEKVRFLEAQNKKLRMELEALQKRSGQGSSKIREMYEVEMNEARKLIDASDRDRANADQQLRDAENELEGLKRRFKDMQNIRDDDRKKIDALQREIVENEAKINLMRRRFADLEDEARRYKMEVQRIVAEINRVQNEIQNEIFLKSCLESEKMTLEEEYNMLKQVHDAELNELRSRSFVDSGLEPSQFFRNELANAIREIREEYETATEQQRNELHNRYMMHYNEIVMRHKPAELMPAQYEQQRIQEEKLRTTLMTNRNEVAHLKARNEELNNRIRELRLVLDAEKDDGDRSIAEKERLIEELRAKLAELAKEHEEVLNMKTSLEQEINKYKELLEGTTSQDGLRQIVEHIEEEARKLEAERLTGSATAADRLSALSRISGRLGGGGVSTFRSVTYSSGGSSYAPMVSRGPILSGMSGISGMSGMSGGMSTMRSAASESKSASAFSASGTVSGLGGSMHYSPIDPSPSVMSETYPAAGSAGSAAGASSYFSQTYRASGGY